MLVGGLANASDFVQPDSFKKHDPGSKFKIQYEDLNILLDNLVIDVGRSKRETAAPQQAKTGTRMKVRVNRSTANEGNRFYYEGIRKEKGMGEILLKVQESLANIPDEISLEHFSRDEQLAYWLNLFNVAMINQVIEVYPQRSLKKLLVGRKSIMDDKILEVGGVQLSLNDIQYTILPENYDNNPLVMYGLYYGIVGGPNIRKRAYNGENVWRYLEANAREFINSNRGTYARDESVFKASSLYERNAVWFGDLKTDLKPHLLQYIQGQEKYKLQSASSIRPDIDDWTVTDLYGTSEAIGGSFATSSAAMLDSVQGQQVMAGDGTTLATGFSVASSNLMEKSPRLSRFSPETLEFMQEIKLRQDEANVDKATVTVEEMGEVPTEPKPEPDDEGSGEG
jgi:hypothetical protein